MTLPHTQITRITGEPDATPSLWNAAYEEIDENLAALDAALNDSATQEQLTTHKNAVNPHPNALFLQRLAALELLVSSHIAVVESGGTAIIDRIVTDANMAGLAYSGDNFSVTAWFVGADYSEPEPPGYTDWWRYEVVYSPAFSASPVLTLVADYISLYSSKHGFTFCQASVSGGLPRGFSFTATPA